MDFRSMLDQVKSAFVIGKGNTFLHGGQPERQQAREYYEPQQAQGQAYGYQAPQQQQAAYQADPFSAPAPDTAYYQQPYQAPYQQQAPQQYYQQPAQQPAYVPQQPVYQQPQPQAQPRQNPGFQTQIDPFGQDRNRRGNRHREEAPLYAQPQPQAQQENLVQFPGAVQPEQPEAPSAGVDAYVINVFNLNSCRQAMSCLRRGQCTLIVMDQLFDKAEIRRYVDMLTGACYALNGTMTRLSAKIGFYIMAPAGMTVYTDPTTSSANAGRPAAAQTPGFGGAAAASAPARGGDFSVQNPYAAPPQMNFSSHQTEARQPAQEAHQQPAYQQPQQTAAPEYYQQPAYQQQYQQQGDTGYQNNPYAARQQDDQQRYAQ